MNFFLKPLFRLILNSTVYVCYYLIQKKMPQNVRICILLIPYVVYSISFCRPR